MIEVESKKVPHSFRNKYLRNSGSVSFSTSMPAPVNGGGVNLDVLKIDDIHTASDENVFSALRALFEIKSRIIALQDSSTPLSDDNTLSSLRTLAEIESRIIKKDDTETKPTDDNTFSSLHIIARIDNAIKELTKELENSYLSKVNDDTAAGHIDFEKGLTSKELLEANNGLVVRNKEIVEAALTSLVEEGTDSLIEELAVTDPPVGGPTTLGGLENVSDDVDVAVTGSLFVKGANWEAVPPVPGSPTDYENMLMPVYHQVLGKWVFISVSSITGGVTPPPVLEMVLDTGVLDVNKLA